MRLNFYRGVKNGLPIALGYIPVAFAFGVLCIKLFPAWVPVVISVTNLTGTGQFVGVDLITAGATFLELTVTMLIINLRYSLMSLSLSQKLDESVTLPQRLLIAFGNTDEIYAVAMRQHGTVPFRYMLGLIACSYVGWVGGTVAGALAGSVFPPILMTAFDIALYAMFIAIIVPAAKDSFPVLKVVILAVAVSCLFYFVPVLNKLGSGWVIIISAVVSAAVGATFFPVRMHESRAQEGRTNAVE